MNYLVYLVLAVFVLRAEEDICVEPSYLIEGNEVLDKANQRMNELCQELDWFLSYSLPITTEEVSDEEDKLAESITHMQDVFLELQRAVCDCIKESLGDSSYAFTLKAFALQDMINWYAKFVETTLFPNGWHSLYQDAQISFSETRNVGTEE